MTSSNSGSAGKTIAIVGGLIGIVVSCIAIFTFVTGIASLNIIGNQAADETSNKIPTVTESENVAPVASPIPQSANADPYPMLGLPFEDDFDAGINSQWRVYGGDPLIVDGRFASAEDKIMLQIGNNNLNNYVVEFDAIDPDPFTCGSGYSGWGYYTKLSIYVSPELYYQVTSSDLNSRGRWYALKDGSWEEIVRDDGFLACEVHVVVSVNNNSYSIHANGAQVSSLIYGNKQGAPFGLEIERNHVAIDNFEIHK